MTDAKPITRQAVLICVSATLKVSIVELLGTNKSKPLVRARWVAALLMRDFCTQFCTSQISITLNRDRTTIIHALQEGARLAKVDDNFADMLKACRRKVHCYAQGEPVAAFLDAGAPTPPPNPVYQPVAKSEPAGPPPRFPRAVDQDDDPKEVVDMRREGQLGTDRMLRQLLKIRASERRLESQSA